MSSILKALRKVEEERHRRGEGTIDLARDILRPPAGGRRRVSGLLPAVCVSGLLVASGIFLSVHLLRKAPSPPPERAATRGLPAPPTAPAIAEIPPPKVRPAAPAATSPVRRPKGMLLHLPTDEKVIEERVGSPRPPLPSAPAGGNVSSVPVPPPPRPPEVRPSAETKPEQGLRLSGIVYLDDPEARVAVINDLPVMKGTAVDGGTVTDILPDRVRLQFPGNRAIDLFLEP